MTAPGGSFSMTEAALRQAENELNDAAARVQRQFKVLEDTVLAQRSRGEAFVASQRVAGELRGQAEKFQRLTEQLATNIGVSAKDYLANSTAGVQAINAVAGAVDGGGATYGRLVPGAGGS